MLSIGQMSAGSESYYADLAREDYYTAGGEPPGEWWGRGAVRLGLRGQVNKGVLSNLFSGYSADGSAALVANAGRADRCAGFDCTFSAVKSVSAIWAASDDDLRAEIASAHAEAVHEALSYLEENATFTRTGAGGVETIRTVNLCVATFEHSTSRALDPNLHTHALVLNFTEGADGKARTLDGREIYRHKMAAGALYRAHLSCLLEQRLGFSLRREGSWFEVEGVSKEVLAHFSKRREAILDALVESGAIGTSAEAAIAALETREDKADVSRSELFSRWKEEASAFGLTKGAIEVSRGEALDSSSKEDLDRVVASAIARITEKQSHFARRELVRFAAEEAQATGLSARDIRLAVWAHLESSPEIVRLGARDRERRFTTQEMYRLEKRMLEAAGRLARSGRHALEPCSIEVAIDARATLSAEQEAAVRHLTSAASVSVVSGMAGTGKSFMLGAAREAFEREGNEVRGLALAAIAAERLEAESGIRSGTLHGLLAQLERGDQDLSSRSVLVLDEAAMVGTRQMERLLWHVEAAGAKLLLVGDERQLQAIEAGSPFKAIGDLVGRAELKDIRRQNHEWAAEAVREFSRGEAGAALSRFIERGLLSIDKSRAIAMTRLVADWSEDGAQDPRENLILAGTNAEVASLNRLCQQSRLSKGVLSKERMRVGEGYLHKGDRVLFRKNSALVKNGSTGIVAAVSPSEGVLSVLLDTGERVTVDTEEYADVSLGYAMTVHKAQGASVDRAFVLIGGAMQDREASYVQASRIRELARLYTDEWTAGENARALVRDMSRSRQKELAHSVPGCELELEID